MLDEAFQKIASLFFKKSGNIKKTGENSINITGSVCGDVKINTQISSEQMEKIARMMTELMSALKSKITIENENAFEKFQEYIDKVLISRISKSVVEICKESLLDETLTIDLENLEATSSQIVDVINEIIARQGDIKSELEQLQNILDADIRNQYSLCEETLCIARKAYSMVNHLAIDQSEMKELIKIQIKFAEERDNLIFSALDKSYGLSEEILKRQKLDSAVIADMFCWIKENCPPVNSTVEAEPKNNVAAKIETRTIEIQGRIKKINEQLDGISDKAVIVLDEMKNVSCFLTGFRDDTKNEHAELKDLLLSLVNKLDQNQGQTASAMQPQTDEEITKLLANIENLKTKLKQEQEKRANLESNGTQALFPCAFCGSQEPRWVVNGHARCERCGHSPLDVDPNCNADLMREVQQWRAKHTPEVYKAADEQMTYNLKMKSDSVSQTGILIVSKVAQRCGSTITINEIDDLYFVDEAQKINQSQITLFIPKNVEIAEQEQHRYKKIVRYDW